MANYTRTISKNAAIGVALLALSGSLLAVDVGATRAVQTEQPAPAAAQAVAVATTAAVTAAAAAHASPARPACPLPVTHMRPGAAPRPAAAPHPSLPHMTLAALIVRKSERRSEHPQARPQARSRATPQPPIARATIRERQPLQIARFVAVRPATAPHPIAKPRRGRSAVEAAQYFALRTVEAQTPGLVHVAAVTRKKGSSRLVVHIIAKTHVGTLVEYEVLRRNGIGFAIESRTTRFVALSTRAARAKAAVRTSPAGHA